ncbi:type II toxin-antitoxin system RelE/ParE family toxin [Corynebacterium sp. zg331]|uniref:type II toxin-antitoxin system RelE family toxin n=1 Tax=unclassified Corynebacterium TaxID=2624378 RepID=UPI00351B746E
MKQLRRLDKPVARSVVRYMKSVADLDDPRARGKALSGPLSGMWRYRVGNYRVIATIEDSHCVVVAVKVDHRSRVYDD